MHGSKKPNYLPAFVTRVAFEVIGIALAVPLRDKRVFCKCVCPVGLPMKPAAHVSLMRVACDYDRCVGCRVCLRACPWTSTELREDLDSIYGG